MSDIYVKKVANNKGFAHIELLVALCVLLVVVLVGAIVFQKSSTKNYHEKLQTAYRTQAEDMAQLYKTFSLPVYSSNDSDSAADDKDLATIDKEIAAAVTATKNLKDANAVLLLPIVASSELSAQHTVMADYIADSMTFLGEYQQLDTYTKGLGKVLDGSLSKASIALGQLLTAQTVPDFIAQTQSSDLDFLKPLEELNSLKPPQDLKVVHSKLTKAVNALQDDLGVINEDISNCKDGNATGDCSRFAQDLQPLVKDSQTFQALSDYDLAGNLQHKSTIHQHILKLQSENPLHY